jgi:hypothetical protein
MQFNNPTSTKNENKKYDNSTFKKINQSRDCGTRLPSHRGRARLLWAFASGASSTTAASTGRRLSEPKHG